MTGTAPAERAAFQIQTVRDCLVVPVPERMHADALRSFQEAVLEKIAARRARGVVFDLSGLRVADRIEAEAVARTARMAGLLGARVALAAMRPGLAATLAALGFTAGGAFTARNVDDALARLG